MADLERDAGYAMRRVAAIALITAAALRACVSIVPQVRFDVDPASDPAGYAGIGPSGSFALDLLVLAASTLAFVAEVAGGRSIVRWLVVVAALPGIAILFHGAEDSRDLFRGSTWVAAAFAAVAGAHLARDPALRRLLAAGLLAVAAPMVVRGLEQVLVEHRQTVAYFDANKMSILAERGWAPGSPAAEGYERRLRQAEATAWLGLANLHSAVMAFGAIGFGWLAVALRRERRLLAPLAAMALGCAALLVINGSKGAFVATLLGLATAAATARFGRRTGGWVAVGCVLLALAAPMVRSALPEAALLGERSLLFRGQYLAGALAALPHAWPFGLGPDGLQEVYLRVKPPRSPEDVTSTHAAFVDWLILLGPLGFAWVLLVGRLLVGWRAEEDRESGRERDLPAVAIAGLALFALLVLAEESIGSREWLLSRGAAALLFALAFAAAMRGLAAVGPVVASAALFGAVAAVFSQSQVEMILFQPGLPVWAMLALGVAAPVAIAPRGAVAPSRLDALPIALPAAMAVSVLAFGLVPQWRQDRLLDRAADVVRPLADVRSLWENGFAAEVARSEEGSATRAVSAIVRERGGVELDAMLRSARASATTPEGRLAAVAKALERFDAGQRAKAADVLRQADRAHPSNPVALESAIKQLAAAGRRTVGPRRPEIVDPALHAAAIDLAREYVDRWGSARAHGMLADLWLERARALSDEPTLDATESALRASVERQPRTWGRRVDLGDVLAARKRYAEAEQSYRAALAIDDDLELDPLARMSPPLREAILRRITATTAAQAGATPPEGWPLR